MTEWSGLDLVPSPWWRGGRRRAGISVGPQGLWVAVVDPDPAAPRLVVLENHPLPAPTSRGQLLTSAGPALSAIWGTGRIPERQAAVSLGAGLVTGAQDTPPLRDQQISAHLLAGPLAGHAVWENTAPVLAVKVLERTPTKARSLYAGTGLRTLHGWRRSLAEAGLQLQGIEPFPWSVLRGLVACGDVVPEGRWGLAVISQGRVWISVWEADALILWRESPAPRLDAGLDADDGELLTLARTIKAGWRFGGVTTAQELWVVGDDAATAGAVVELLQGENLPAQIPLHARLGPMAKGGATALAALGMAAADSLDFPQAFWLGTTRNRLKLPGRKQVAAAMLVAGLLACGMVGHALVDWQSSRLEQERTALAQSLADLEAAVRESDRAPLAAVAPGWPLEQILEQVRTNIPQDTWLKALDIKEDGRLVLEGETLAMRSPLLYSWNLDHVPGWRRVRLEKVTDEGGIYTFTLQAMLDRDRLTAGGAK